MDILEDKVNIEKRNKNLSIFQFCSFLGFMGRLERATHIDFNGDNIIGRRPDVYYGYPSYGGGFGGHPSYGGGFGGHPSYGGGFGYARPYGYF